MMNDSVHIQKYLTSSFWQSEESAILGDDSRVSEALASIRYISGAILFRTSGSSGMPKWVVHTRASIMSSAQSVIDHLKIIKSDCWYLALPIEHVGGFGILARAYLAGSRVVSHDGKWDAKTAVERIDDEGVSLISLVPTQVTDIVRGALACPKSVRAVIVGGGALADSVRAEALELGWPILLSYGMCETGSQIATQRSPSSDGVEIITPWEHRATEKGELEVKGEGLFEGYLTEENGGWQLIDPKMDGWFTTKDYVEIKENRLKFLSRGDCQLKILGELVDVSRLEAKLTSLMQADVYIVEKADARRGYLLIPVMEKAKFSQTRWDEIESRGLESLEEIQFCERFPKNVMGKLNRTKLRESIVFSDK